MKKLGLIALAVFAAGAASAQDTTVMRKEGDLGGSKTVIKHGDDAKVVKKVRVERNVGCDTKTVKKTNDMGESVTKTKSSC